MFRGNFWRRQSRHLTQVRDWLGGWFFPSLQELRSRKVLWPAMDRHNVGSWMHSPLYCLLAVASQFWKEGELSWGCKLLEQWLQWLLASSFLQQWWCVVSAVCTFCPGSSRCRCRMGVSTEAKFLGCLLPRLLCLGGFKFPVKTVSWRTGLLLLSSWIWSKLLRHLELSPIMLPFRWWYLTLDLTPVRHYSKITSLNYK